MVTAQLSNPVLGGYPEDFDVVVLARGVAREKVTVPNDADVPITKRSPKFVSLRFWQRDGFQQPALGLASVGHHVLISGGGDGALQDYIRLVTGSNSALLLLEDICARMPQGARLVEALRWRLAEAEEQAHRMQLWSADSGDDHEALARSLSGILCARHSMTTRSIYANKQDEVKERGDCREVGGIADDPEGTH